MRDGIPNTSSGVCLMARAESNCLSMQPIVAIGPLAVKPEVRTTKNLLAADNRPFSPLTTFNFIKSLGEGTCFALPRQATKSQPRNRFFPRQLLWIMDQLQRTLLSLVFSPPARRGIANPNP